MRTIHNIFTNGEAPIRMMHGSMLGSMLLSLHFPFSFRRKKTPTFSYSSVCLKRDSRRSAYHFPHRSFFFFTFRFFRVSYLPKGWSNWKNASQRKTVFFFCSLIRQPKCNARRKKTKDLNDNFFDTLALNLLFALEKCKYSFHIFHGIKFFKLNLIWTD